jgi:urocanate hydratase
MGEAINELVKRGDLKAPIAIGRDHLDTGSVLHLFGNRRNEGRLGRGGRLANSQRALEHRERRQLGFIPSRRWCRDRLLASRRQVLSRRWHGRSAKRLNRVLTNDPGLGVARHADAGYEEAIETAKEKGVKIPMLNMTNK